MSTFELALQSFFYAALLVFWQPIVVPLLGMIFAATLVNVASETALRWMKRPKE